MKTHLDSTIPVRSCDLNKSDVCPQHFCSLKVTSLHQKQPADFARSEIIQWLRVNFDFRLHVTSSNHGLFNLRFKLTEMVT